MDDCPFEDPDDPKGDHFENMMFQLTVFLGAIQEEISKSLILNDKIKKDTEAITNKPDHEIARYLDNVAANVVLAFPVAAKYGVNLPINIIEHHSSITGNPVITQVLERIREKINTYNYN